MTARSMAFLLGVLWVVCGALMAFNPPPEGNSRGSVIPFVGWVVIAAGIYFAVKSLRLQSDTDMGRPAGYVSGATPGPAKLLLACVIGAIMGAGTVWWGISSGLLSVIGLGGVMLSMTVLVLPQLVTQLGAASQAGSDEAVPQGFADPYVYDKIDWHTAGAMDAGFDDDEQAAVPAAFFYGWLLSRGLFSGDYAQPGSDMFDDYQARRVTALELYRESDGCLDERDLTDEGNAFTRSYYRIESPCYFDDYEDTLAVGLPSPYHVPYTWENQERMDAIIGQRYAQWRTEHSSAPQDPSPEEPQ
ncbi:DUF308 domain-containing protein [Mycolicibacterium lutetiense]|uniref:DUF7832 domain-containing protein n=1 Tax=Mycolicibacterium lutetiense TaxID=1641992 RepID=A0ABS4ZVV4_9MYCO|nr:DUF308 domain-containing protein [Mycolicibacterium lutetiense]MBP2452724.1 hypothetical protein [Mycolicibacterium lutetiense]